MLIICVDRKCRNNVIDILHLNVIWKDNLKGCLLKLDHQYLKELIQRKCTIKLLQKVANKFNIEAG